MPPLLGHLQSHFAVISLRYGYISCSLGFASKRLCWRSSTDGSGALKRYLKVCQRHDIHEVLGLFVAEIGLDSARERTTPIERSFRTGFLYGSLYCNAPIAAYLWPAALIECLPMRWNDRIGRRLKLHDLHIFMTVAETGSMGKAAELLSISQSSVSKAIAEIEHTIGVRLLDRTPKGVAITAYGRALLRRGIGAFHELRQSIKDIELLSDPMAGDVQIGCPEAIACGLLLAILDRFSCQHPRVVLSVHAANNMPLQFRMLRDRNVDFLIGGLPKPVADDDLDIEVLYWDRPFIVSGAKNRWAGRRKVELAELVDEPWLLAHESIFSSLVEEAFQSQRLARPKLGVRTYSTYQRLSLLATNSFIGGESGSVLRFNIDRFPLKVLPIDFPFRSWPIAIVTLKDRTLSSVVQTFIECAREVAAMMTPEGAQHVKQD